MPDDPEGVVEEQLGVPEPEAPKEPETPAEPPIEEDLTKEPGGDSPESIYQRRRARELKQAKEQLEQERLARARAEERAKTLEEQGKKPEKETLTIAKVNAAVDRGETTRELADRYIEEVIWPAKLDAWEKKRQEKQQQLAPIERANTTIAEYARFIPGIRSEQSSEYEKAATRAMELVQEFGYDIKDPRTQVLALRDVFGPLDKVKKKAEIDNLNRERGGQIPVETSAGGPRRPVNGKIDINKAPQTMIDGWDREGADQATRERRYKIYLDLKAKQSAR